MIFKNRIYGKSEISSPILIELINSLFIRRLKKICQFGVPDEFYQLKNYSRYEHSIGVMLLIKQLGGTEEEQIAGLLHDISHTAFSHIIDWVLGEGKEEEFQNKKHADFFIDSEISNILKKYKYNPKIISDHKNFSLLEQDIPNLCADRIDYAIKEFPVNTARKCFNSMRNYKGKIVFKNLESAHLFAINFLKRQTVHWGGFEAASRYRLFADALRLALKKGVIKFDDFWQTDDFVLKKIRKAKDKEIEKILDILRNKSLKDLPKSRKKVYKKFRYVDPEFIQNGKIVKLSKSNKKFKKELDKEKELNKKGVLIPLIKN